MGSFEDDLAKACGPARKKPSLSIAQGLPDHDAVDWRAHFLTGIESLDVEAVGVALSIAPCGKALRETMAALAPYSSWLRSRGSVEKVKAMLLFMDERGLPLCAGNGEWMADYLSGAKTQSKKFRRHEVRRLGFDMAAGMAPSHASAAIALAEVWSSSGQPPDCRFECSDWIDEAFVWSGSSRAACESLLDEMAPMVDSVIESLGARFDDKQWGAVLDHVKSDGQAMAEGPWPAIVAKALDRGSPRDGRAAASELARLSFMSDSVELLGALARAAAREGWALGAPMAIRGRGFESPYGAKAYEPVSWIHAASALLFEKKHWAEGGGAGSCMAALANTPEAAKAALACDAPWAFSRASLDAMKSMCSAEPGLFAQDADFARALPGQDLQEWAAYKERHDLSASLGAVAPKTAARRI